MSLPAPTNVVIIRDEGTLEALIHEWAALGESALCDNPFFGPAFLLPAWRSLRTGAGGVSVVTHRHPTSGKLVGLYPVTETNRLPWAKIWRHPYCFLATPLLRAPSSAEGLHAHILSGEYLDEKWVDGISPHNRIIRGVFLRRALPTGSLREESILEVLLTGERRKDIRRKERQLLARGGGAVELLDNERDLPLWIEDFLRLEASGWKGLEKTALASNRFHARFFRDICYELFRTHQLFFARYVTSQRRAIAYRCGILGRDTHFAFKAAYDESWSAVSPGLLLELAVIEATVADPRIVQIDSCAAPGASLFERLYLGSRTLILAWIRSPSADGNWGDIAWRCAEGLHRLGTIKKRFADGITHRHR